MLLNGFRYTIGHFSLDGECLGGVPFEPDWAPAEESVRFTAVRKGQAPATWPDGRVEPVWSRAGAPYLAGIRVVLLDGSESIAEAFPVDYFAPSARLAFRKVSRSNEESEEPAFLFVVTAVPIASEAASSTEGRAKPAKLVAADGRFEERPIPEGARAVSRSLGSPSDYPVFIEQDVVEGINLQVLENPERETGGILVGSLFRRSSARDVFAIVNAYVPAPFTEADDTRLRFTPETWAALRAETAAFGGGAMWLGWYHSHPGQSAHFFSEHDLHLHRAVFPAAHQVALVATMAPGAPTSLRMYGWRKGVVAARSFSVIEAEARRTGEARLASSEGVR